LQWSKNCQILVGLNKTLPRKGKKGKKRKKKKKEEKRRRGHYKL
jgi:hypothetical protein